MLRYLPPQQGEAGAAFAALNYGKRSLAIDLRREEGRELCLGLVGTADVVVESFRPGVLARLGLAYEELARANPRVVLCSISGYGQQGPLKDAPGHDLNYVARAGLLELFGPPAGPPQIPGVQLADLAGGALTAAIGVLAALLERQASGRGRHLDISMTRGASAFLAMELARRAAGHIEPRGRGTLTGGLPCYRVYCTADRRYMALAALEPKFFAAFCERAGCQHLAGSGLASGEEGEAVVAELEALFASRSQQEWCTLLAGSASCCEPVQTPEEAAADPGLGMHAVTLEGGAVALATDVGDGPQWAKLSAPRLGEYAREVARDFEIPAALVERAVLAGALLELAEDDTPGSQLGRGRQYP